MNIANDLEPLLLDRKAAARLLGTTERHVARLNMTGELPAVRIGGRVRVRRRDVQRLSEGLVAMPDRSRFDVG